MYAVDWARRRFEITVRNQCTYDGTSTEIESEWHRRYHGNHYIILFLQLKAASHQDFQDACGRRSVLEGIGESICTRCTRLGGAMGAHL